MRALCVDGPINGQWIAPRPYELHFDVWVRPKTRIWLDEPLEPTKPVRYTYGRRYVKIGDWHFLRITIAHCEKLDDLSLLCDKRLEWELGVYECPNILEDFDGWMKWTMVQLNTPFSKYVKEQRYVIGLAEKVQRAGRNQPTEKLLPNRMPLPEISRELHEDCIIPPRYFIKNLHS